MLGGRTYVVDGLDDAQFGLLRALPNGILIFSLVARYPIEALQGRQFVESWHDVFP